MKIIGSALTRHQLLLQQLLGWECAFWNVSHCSKASQSPLITMTPVHQGKCGHDNRKQMEKTDIEVTLLLLLTVIGAHECDMSSTESHILSQNVTSQASFGNTRWYSQTPSCLSCISRKTEEQSRHHNQSPAATRQESGGRQESSEADGPLWWPHRCRTALTNLPRKAIKQNSQSKSPVLMFHV